ncbi:MAG: WG repeat-containing protein [Chitinophagaceae bacterium]
MNKTKYIVYSIIALFFFAAFRLSAQTEIKAWKVEYEIGVSQNDTLMTELLGALSGLDKDKPAIRAYVSPEKIRVEQNGLSPYVQVGNLKDSISYKFPLTIDSVFNSQKIAYKVPLATPKMGFGSLDDTSVFLSSDLKMTLSDETQTILGKTCNLAKFDLLGKGELWVWYAKGLPKLYWGEYDYLEQVPGLLLKIESHIPQSNFDFGITAKSLEEVSVDPSIFEVPEDYKLEDLYSVNEDSSYGDYAFHNGLQWVDNGELWGIADSSGKLHTPYKYTMRFDFEKDLAIVFVKDKAGIVDRKGKEVVVPQYGNIVIASDKLFYALKEPGLYALYSSDGKKLTDNLFNLVKPFSEGRAAVSDRDSKYGFIDESGKLVIPFRYDYADGFRDGVASVTLDGKTFNIDYNGNQK